MSSNKRIVSVNLVPRSSPNVANVRQASGSSKKRRRRRRLKPGPKLLPSTQVALVRAVKRGRNRQPRLNRMSVAATIAGQAFLQGTIAPRDFPGQPAFGVPDEYAGSALLYRFQGNFTPDMSAGKNVFVVAPVPGVAFLQSQSGATPWTAVSMPQFASIFPTVDIRSNTTNVQKFRIVAQTIEVKLISPVLTSGGMISAARMPGVTINTQMSAAGAMTRTVTGLTRGIEPSAISQQPGYYAGHVNSGVYGWSINEQGSWDFSDIWTDTAGRLIDGDRTGANVEIGNNVPGWGNMTPLIVRFDNLTEDTAVVIVVEQVVEFQPRSGTLLAAIAEISPEFDPPALLAYERAGHTLPAFVPAAENAGFWERFLKFVGGVGGMLSRLPGPVGQVAGGVGAVANGLRTLVV